VITDSSHEFAQSVRRYLEDIRTLRVKTRSREIDFYIFLSIWKGCVLADEELRRTTNVCIAASIPGVHVDLIPIPIHSRKTASSRKGESPKCEVTRTERDHSPPRKNDTYVTREDNGEDIPMFCNQVD